MVTPSRPNPLPPGESTPSHPNPLPEGEGTIGRRLWAYAELLRLPNLPTAAADVMMGYVVTHGSLWPAGPVSLLVVASCLLYLAGMVLNDVADAAVDARERPGRPIPSGRVSLAGATATGWALVASGVLVAWLAGYWTGMWRPAIVGSLLAAAVALYDTGLKRTPVGPLAMGSCRVLNVLLGMSVASETLTGRPRAWEPAEWIIALGVGTYIAGLTLFARTEAGRSSRLRLAAGTAILLAGIALVASLPLWLSPGKMIVVASRGWYLLWAVLALVIVRRCTLAILRPAPRRVQAAVRNGLQSLIVLDAVVSLAFGGVYWGCAILLLLVPTLALAQVLDST